MGKKKKKEKDDTPPANSYNYSNGMLVSSSVYDPSRNAYVNTTYADPAQEQECQLSLQK